jgi:hypothetical protein
MVDVLLLCRELGADPVELAVRGALAAGACDGRAVALLARRVERPAAAPLELAGPLARVGTAAADLSGYDALLERGGN